MKEVSICHSGYFRAKCAWDELLVIAHARYGRMRINKCVSENFGYVGCSIDVVDVLDRYCSGRRTCNVRMFQSVPGCSRYSRMLRGVPGCSRVFQGVPGCSRVIHAIDVVDVLDRYCSGRRTCHIRVFQGATVCSRVLESVPWCSRVFHRRRGRAGPLLLRTTDLPY